MEDDLKEYIGTARGSVRDSELYVHKKFGEKLDDYFWTDEHGVRFRVNAHQHLRAAPWCP